jgi:hypothetical protein
VELLKGKGEARHCWIREQAVSPEKNKDGLVAVKSGIILIANKGVINGNLIQITIGT